MTSTIIESFDKMVSKYSQGDYDPDQFESIDTIHFQNGYPSQKDICFMAWDICKDRQINFPSKFNLKMVCNKVQSHYTRGTAKWYQLKNEWYAEMFDH